MRGLVFVVLGIAFSCYGLARLEQADGPSWLTVPLPAGGLVVALLGVLDLLIKGFLG